MSLNHTQLYPNQQIPTDIMISPYDVIKKKKPNPNPNPNISHIQRFHIINSKAKGFVFGVDDVYAPFGRQTKSEHNTNNNMTQHRFNIGFSRKQIESNDETYQLILNIINKFEQFFKDFDELDGYKLVSNHIDREKHGCIFRFHLKTYKNKTTTPFVQIVSDHTTTKTDHITTESEWIAYDILQKVNIEFSPDCLWIDDVHKTYGISFIINKVWQLRY